MEETVEAGTGCMEFEVRGDAWEGVHAVLFYVTLAVAILATLGVAPMATGISTAVLLFYTMFAIFSSPTYVVIDAAASECSLERYRYFIPLRRRLSHADLKGLTVIESARPPAEPGEKGSRKDLSYFVRVYLDLQNGRRLKIFRSGITGSPYENREKAFLVARETSAALRIPVSYGRRGAGEGPREARPERE